MKRLLFVFIAMLLIVLIVGLNSRREKAEFDAGGTTTVITTAEDEQSSPLAVEETDKTGEEGGLTVLNLPDSHLDITRPYQVVRGKAPQNAYRIKVNDYTLQRYRPGQDQWSYIAATRFGTLKKGDNSYTVTALDREGETLGQTTFTIAYTAPMAVPALPNSGSPLMMTFWITLVLSAIGLRLNLLKN